MHHQQRGPLIVNVGSPNPRYLSAANPYGQGFLAQLYALCICDVDVKKMGVKQIKK
jgi:unsaturated rhamnogalacturonyl hydrolase